MASAVVVEPEKKAYKIDRMKVFFSSPVFLWCTLFTLRASGDVVLCVRQGVSAMRAMFLEVREGCWTCIRGLFQSRRDGVRRQLRNMTW